MALGGPAAYRRCVGAAMATTAGDDDGRRRQGEAADAVSAMDAREDGAATSSMGGAVWTLTRAAAVVEVEGGGCTDGGLAAVRKGGRCGQGTPGGAPRHPW